MSLEELLKRVEGADGPDREIDAALEAWSGSEAFCETGEVPRHTASLDAAIGLVERVLPGHWWRVDSVGQASIGGFKDKSGSELVIDGSNWRSPPLALLSALLRALQAKETGE